MKKIVVIGELCHDVFVYGECKRLSPEAPVPVFNPLHTVENQGMAGNVVANINAITPSFKISFYHSKEKMTKTRYVDKKTNHLFLRVDDDLRLTRIHISKELLSDIEDADALVISDYNKGFIAEDDLVELSKLAKFSIIDTKKKLDVEHLSMFDFIKVNESEYMANKEALDQLKGKAIITLGSNGARYINNLYHSPSPKETIDVSGAGDTFLAAFVTKYLQTQDASISITFANQMSAVVVSKRGVATP
jgi:D-beta-D-heptose 7-phosphate kinase/D-beta-D-heptose 1-phosphate adenosyltransferase